MATEGLNAPADEVSLSCRRYDATNVKQLLSLDEKLSRFVDWVASFFPRVTEEDKEERVIEYRWFNIFFLTLIHVGAVYGFYLSWYASWRTWVFLSILIYWCGIGITGGAHRLWAHRAYKASLPLRIWLMLCQTLAYEGDIYEWTRDHRAHHKYSETNGDPYNSSRGFWFAHMGWVCQKKHPDVIKAGKEFNMQDVLQDPVVKFQRKFYLLNVLAVCYVMPCLVCLYLDNSAWLGFWMCGVMRHVCVLHSTWCVNSVAHIWGSRPYDPNIAPAESWFTAVISMGEGWHNYHHTFPYDYSASELGFMRQYNPTTLFIDICAWLGLAWDLRKVDKTTLEAVVARQQAKSGKEKAHHHFRYDHNKDGSYHIMTDLNQEAKKTL
eukprot:gnl/Spiro4/2328_TR1124_c0_g1_i1.p1 gnl/Spiro4/2328_TR1124_c0_g1~~gnl/Spiro4/2328_TR1124_c0_g1_i1.p1  ORF type:complete len:393 (-),score=112.79 gnl/Spiro4/2328_TR1124_c0_g1_i1:76-1215(-)